MTSYDVSCCCWCSIGNFSRWNERNSIAKIELLQTFSFSHTSPVTLFAFPSTHSIFPHLTNPTPMGQISINSLQFTKCHGKKWKICSNEKLSRVSIEQFFTYSCGRIAKIDFQFKEFSSFQFYAFRKIWNLWANLSKEYKKSKGKLSGVVSLSEMKPVEWMENEFEIFSLSFLVQHLASTIALVRYELKHRKHDYTMSKLWTLPPTQYSDLITMLHSLHNM